jgi:hypothetical protein
VDCTSGTNSSGRSFAARKASGDADPDKDVYDCGIFSETGGVVEPALTDVVALEFGVDLPG